MLKPHARVAVSIAQALVDARFDEAMALLAPDCRAEYTTERLEHEVRAMCEYADGLPSSIRFEKEYCFDEPEPEPGDLGWVYVGPWGDGLVEAVTVLVCSVDEKSLIRKIEWGRP